MDVQDDVCPGGAWPVPNGEQVILVLNRWIRAANAQRALIVAAQDWHPPHHASFELEGGPCSLRPADARGAMFHGALDLLPGTRVFSKGRQQELGQYDVEGVAR